MERICRHCGYSMPGDSKFCPKCGSEITELRCSGCGRVLPEDAQFCLSCGAPVSCPEKEPAREAPPREDTGMTAPPQGETKKEHSPEAKSFSWKYYKNSIWSHWGQWTNVTAQVGSDDLQIATTIGKSKKEQRIPYSSITESKSRDKVSVFWMLLPLLALLGGIAVFATGAGVGYALLLLAFSALIFFVCSVDIRHQELTITQADGKKTKLISKVKDRDILIQLQKEIAERAKFPAAANEASTAAKSGKGALKLVGVIAGVCIVGFVGYLLFEQLYIIRAFPRKMLASDAAVEQLREQFADDIGIATLRAVNKDLDRETAMPKHDDSGYTYLYVRYTYDAELTDFAGKKTSVALPVTAAFTVSGLFDKEPGAIMFNAESSPELDTALAEYGERLRQQILPAASGGFTMVDAELPAIYENGDRNFVTAIYEANNGAGYVFTVKGDGYGGEGTISLMVSTDADGNIVQTRVLHHSELSEAGQNITSEAYQGQFAGINKNTLNMVDAITEATISSDHYVDSIRSVLDAYDYVAGESVYLCTRKVSESVSTSGNTSTHITEYEYDTSGKLAAEKNDWYDDDPEYGGYSSYVTSYTYDEQGNTLMTRTEYDNGSVSVMTYSYDSSGNVLSESQKYDNYSYTNTYTYDTHGQKLTEEYTDSNGNALMLSYSNFYDNSGNLTQAVGTSGTATYSYDGNGNIVVERIVWDGGSIEETTRSYDSNGNLLEEYTETTYLMESGEYSTDTDVRIYTYDSNGKMLTEQHDSWDASFYTEYTYDANGNLIKSDGNGWSYMFDASMSEVITYEYELFSIKN